MRSFLSATLAALAISLVTCGGSSITPPPPAGGFSNASLKGHYAFSMSGVDLTGAYLARVGSFNADGAGNVTAALEDVLDLSSGQPAQQVSFTGSYQIQANGRGTLTFAAASGEGLQLTLAMQSTSGGFLVETDLNASSSGTFSQQNSADFSASALTNQFVFSFSGVAFAAKSAAPISLIGEITLNGGGAIISGVMDTNNGNLAAPSGATVIAPGTYQMDTTGNGTTFGRGTMSFAGYSFAFYIVDSTHIMVLEEDFLGGTSGDALLQTAPVPTHDSQFSGSFVYLVGGASVLGSQGPVARAARFTADGNGGLGTISLDDNNDGNYLHISQGSNISKATYTIDSTYSGSGRGTFTFTDSSHGTYSDVFYAISSSQAVVQELSKGIIGSGPLYAQSGGPFSLGGLAGKYVFNWSGVQLGSTTAIPLEEDFVGQYALSNLASSNISGVIDYVEFGLTNSTPFLGVGLGGTLTITGDGTANNLYKFAVGGSAAVTINYQAYFANGSKVLLVCSDSNRTLAGILNQQSQ